jgi:hypothetical protein
MAVIIFVAYVVALVSAVAFAFFYVYLLSKRFRRYVHTRPQFFPLSLLFGSAGVAILTASALIKPESIALATAHQMTYMHTAGEIFVMLMALLLCRMTLDMSSALSGERKRIPHEWILFFSVFVLSSYYTAALAFYSPINSFLMAVNFTVAVDGMLLLILSLMGVMDISRRLAAGSEVYVYGLLFFVSYHLFYQVHAFLISVVPLTLPSGYAEAMNSVRIIFTVVPVALAFAMFIRLGRTLARKPEIPKVTDKKLIPFLDEVSQLIGESTMTIYRYGMEDYRKAFPGGKENDELYQYLVRYFEDYIGPVSARIAREIEAGERNGARFGRGPGGYN